MNMKSEYNIAVVLAGGRGSRMNSKVQKQYLILREKPVIYYSLAVFQKSFVDEIILVVPECDIEYCRVEIVQKYHFTKVKKIVAGGKERYHSVYHALQAADSCDTVFIHDGARPFVTEEILDRTYQSVLQYHACVAGMPVKDTIRTVSLSGFSTGTPERSGLWQIQTPQVFSYSLLREAYDKLMIREANGELDVTITDDAMVVENFMKRQVRLVEGSYRNIKITTPEDLLIADAFLGADSD